MTKKIEHRTAEIRTVGDGTFEAIAVVYNIVDDYGTRFRQGCFSDSLRDRLPKIAWSHNWDDPIGRVVDYRDDANALTIIAELDDANDVPRVRQAMAQLRSGTISDVSVGFVRKSDERTDDGFTDITEAELDEVSLVLRGAVPGAKVLSMRSGGLVSADQVAKLMAGLTAGTVDLHDALGELKQSTVFPDDPTEEPEGEEEEPETEPDEIVDVDDIVAEIDEALSLAERSR